MWKEMAFYITDVLSALSQTMEAAVKRGLWKECICQALKYAVPQITRIDTQTKSM